MSIGVAGFFGSGKADAASFFADTNHKAVSGKAALLAYAKLLRPLRAPEKWR
jgi:dephospho-CoA kinase